MTTLRIAVPTKGSGGMRDMVSDVFARAATFTIIDVDEGEVKHVVVDENTASELKQGTGPIVAKNLKEKGVDVVIAGEVGPGAKTLLEMNNIRMIQIEPGVRVSEAVKTALDRLRTEKTKA